jgi:hypothetical protein
LCKAADSLGREKLSYGETQEPKKQSKEYTKAIQQALGESLPPTFRVYLSVSPETAKSLESGRIPRRVEAHLHPMHVRRVGEECVLAIAIRPTDILAITRPEVSGVLLDTADLYEELINAEYIR